MVVDSERYQTLQRARQDIILKLTQLNARHISSQGRLSGIELLVNRCREACKRGDDSEDFIGEIAIHEREISEIEHVRKGIDEQRDALNEELLKLDQEIQVCS